MQIAAVAGGDDTLYCQLQSPDWHHPVYIYNFVENLPTMMKAADLIICKAGGLIVTEALACGLPLLIVDVIPGQETGNAEYIIQNGAGELGETPLATLKILYHWLDKEGELLVQRAKNARQLGKPRAAFDVADLCWKFAQCGPLRRTSQDIPGRSKLINLLSRQGMVEKTHSEQ